MQPVKVSPGAYSSPLSEKFDLLEGEKSDALLDPARKVT